MDNINKFVSGFKKVVAKLGKIIHKLTTTVGQIVALAVILVFVVIVAVIFSETIGLWFNKANLGNDFAGISSDADYEYIVSSFSDAGYDSLLTEKTYQEFLAYEYSVLMDVADNLFEIQNKEENGLMSLAVPVTAEYDISKTDEATWRQRVISGQQSARFEDTEFLSALRSDPNIADNEKLGSNKDVVPPRLVFEFKRSSVSGEKIGSLVPYIYILKEDITYNYYSVGAATSDGATEPDGGRGNYSKTIDGVENKRKVCRK